MEAGIPDRSEARLFKSMFSNLFSDGAEKQTDIPDYKTTHNLVMRLVEAQQRCEAG